MATNEAWPSAEVITTATLILDPLKIDDAADLSQALDDPELHTFIGGEPASVDELRSRFAHQVVGQSPDGSEGWLNWVVRDSTSLEAIGTVQTTLTRQPEGLVAEVSWVVATPWQGQGRAKDAAGALVAWLREHGVHTLVAHVHPDHAASAGVARSLGLTPTEVVVDGEVRWVSNE